MATENRPEWLPAGWTMQTRKIGIRTIKCYLDPEGNKFYSKPQVFRHLKITDNSTATEKTHNADGSTGDVLPEPDVPQQNEVPESTPPKRSPRSISKKSRETGDGPSSEPNASPTDGLSEWLPDGWRMEVLTRDQGSRIGMRYKCYIESVSGRRFYSKPQVLNYLASTSGVVARQRKTRTIIGDKSATEPEKSQKSEAIEVENSKDKTKIESVQKSSDYEVISSTPADGLPPGWIKEIRVRKNSPQKKKDPLYLDPLSGYIFLSKLDALRYLDTGDIKKCAMKPLRRDSNGDYHNGDNQTAEELALPLDLSEGNDTPEGLANGGVAELETNGEFDTSGSSDVGRHRRSKKKKNSIADPPYNEVVTASPADGLPPGWIKEIRTRQYSTHQRSDPFYTDPVSGYEFRSKLDALRYLETGDIGKCAIKPAKRDVNGNRVDVGDGSSAKPKKRRASRKDKVSDWLPEGWIADVKTRYSGTSVGMRFKCYTETASGRKFYSKPQVLDYLASGGYSSTPKKRKVSKSSSEADMSGDYDVGTSKRSKRTKRSIVDPNPLYTEEVTTSPADGLPPGWIKEIRTRKYATHQRKDPYYTDTVSGYIFRSKLDALRYLETGDISTCAMKPTKRDIDGNPIVIDGATPVNAISSQVLEENNNIPTETPDGTDPKPAEKTSISTPPSRKMTKLPTRGKSSATLPGRSSKRLKGIEPELNNEAARNDGNGHLEGNGEVKEKQVTGVNVEKQAGGETGEAYEDGESWTDQCLDFAVQTLTGEIIFDAPPVHESVGPGSEAGVNVNVNENPTKVN